MVLSSVSMTAHIVTLLSQELSEPSYNHILIFH